MEPLAIVTRNDYVESLHYGFICVVDSSGEVLYSLGDYNTKIFFRSSAKPIQTIPFIQSGASEAMNFSLKEIAIACASHSGQKSHQEVVQGILNKIGLNDANMHCGIIKPKNKEEHERLILEGESPSVFHCGCSGKHSAMLALSKYRGYNVGNYENLSNPVQQEILNTIAEFAEEDPNSITTATDGCGVPVYLLPIRKIALTYAKLIMYSQNANTPYHNSCKIIFDAMTQFPEMIAGRHEFCTELMQATGGRLIGKVGNEGVYCLGIKEGNLGICIKITDGSQRAVYPVVIELLKQLGLLNPYEQKLLSSWHKQKLKNNHGEIIGEILPVLNLQSTSSNNIIPGMKWKS